MLALVPACLLALLPVFSAHAQTDEEPWGDLKYAETESVSIWDPYLAPERSASDRLFAVLYEGLVRYEYYEERHLPMLAERYEQAPGSRSITFTLRPGVRWHDGEAFTAADVQFTYAYIRQRAPLKIRRAYEGFDVEVVDDLTVRATFDEALPLPEMLPFFEAWMLPAHLFEKTSGLFVPRREVAPLRERPIGTGPYRFRGQSITGDVALEVNRAYWGRRGRLARLMMDKANDPGQLHQSALYGDHKLMIEVPPKQMPLFEEEPRFILELYPSFSIYTFAYNFKDPRLQDRRVRQALTYATDRQGMLDQWFNGKGHLLANPFNRYSYYYDNSVQPLPYDPARARVLLNQAGYTRTDREGYLVDRQGRRLSFELANYVEKVAGATTNQNLAATFRDQLKAVGVEVRLVPLPLVEYHERVFLKNDFDVALVQWTFDPLYDVKDLFASGAIGGNNIIGYRNERVDAIIRQFEEEDDAALRIEYMKQLGRVLAEECPYTFVLSVDKHAAIEQSLVVNQIDPYYFFTHLPEWYIPPEFRY